MKKKEKKRILDKAYKSAVITFAFMEFSQVGSGLVDGLITNSFLGSEAMAAVGLGYPLFSLAGLVGGIVSTGMQIICSKETGKGNFDAVSKISTTAMEISLVISLALAFIFMLFVDPIVVFLGAKDVTSTLFIDTSNYVSGLLYSIPALVLSAVLSSALQLDGDGKLVSISALSYAGLDVILDIVAAKTGMGLLGMGLATSIAQYFGLFVLFFHFVKKERMLHLKFGFKAINRMKDIVVKGGIVGVKRLANVIRPLIINNYIIMIAGTIGMSAMSIKSNISSFLEIFGASVASAVTLVMGISFGEKSKDDIFHLGKTIHKFAIYGNGILIILVCILAKAIAGFYVEPGTELYKLVLFAIYVAVYEIFLKTLIGSRINYLNVASKVFLTQLLQLGLNLLAVIPGVLIMGSLFNVYGAISGVACGYTLLVIAIYLFNAFKVKKPRVTGEDYLLLDDSFELSPKDVIELDINSMEEAALASEQLQLFCNGHKLDKKRGFYSALAIEESIRLIYENNKNPEEISIDLRIVYENDNLIIRLRDNGSSAYPFGGLSEDDVKADPTKNIGISMLRKVAKDITYYHSLSINYTIITV